MISAWFSPLVDSVLDRRRIIPSTVAASRIKESIPWIMHEFAGP